MGTRAADERLLLSALLFRLDGLHFGVPINSVEEILPALPVEKLPDCPPFLRGVVTIGPRCIPVLRTEHRLGLAEQDPADMSQLICLRHQQRLIGLEVEDVVDLVELNNRGIDAEFSAARKPGVLLGLIECEGVLTRLLNSDDLLTPEEAESLNNLPLNDGTEMDVLRTP